MTSATLMGSQRAWAARLLLIQSLVGLALALVFYLAFGDWWGLSILLGSAIAVLGNACLSWHFFRHGGARAAHKILKSFYWGETLKMLLSLLLFALVFSRLDEVKPALVLLGFFVVQCSHALALLIKR